MTECVTDEERKELLDNFDKNYLINSKPNIIVGNKEIQEESYEEYYA
jgi:hypothetical protein